MKNPQSKTENALSQSSRKRENKEQKRVANTQTVKRTKANMIADHAKERAPQKESNLATNTIPLKNIFGRLLENLSRSKKQTLLNKASSQASMTSTTQKDVEVFS